MRQMTQEDLGDCRVFEDEAIREQAARLQIHAFNLFAKVADCPCISWETVERIQRLGVVVEDIGEVAERQFVDNPL